MIIFNFHTHRDVDTFYIQLTGRSINAIRILKNNLNSSYSQLYIEFPTFLKIISQHFTKYLNPKNQ